MPAIINRPKHYGDFKSLPPTVDRFVRDVVLKHEPNFQFKRSDRPLGLYRMWAWLMTLFIPAEIRQRVISNVLNECWVPKNFLLRPELNIIEVLAHELCHMYDHNRFKTIPFALMYFTPQVLAVFSIFALGALGGNLMWLFVLLAFLFLLPIPSPGRMWAEMRGYRMEMLIARDVRDFSVREMDELADVFVENFTKSTYFWMWPFAGWVKTKLFAFEEFENEQPYVEVVTWLQTSQLGS